MYCKKCGKEITEDSVYCKYCGARQTPQKITIEFNKPPLKINEDLLRSIIFGLGRVLKRVCIILLPFVLRLIIGGIIAVITWNGIYYGMQWLYEPPVESIQSIQNFNQYGVSHGHYVE